MQVRVIFAVFVIFLSVASARGQERKLEPFVFAYTSVTGNRAPIWVGKDAGIFEKYGLDLKIVQIFMAYSEAISVGRKNKELVLQAFRKYMRIDDPRLLEGTYKIQFLDTIPLRPYPNEEAIQIQIDDLATPSAPKLKVARAADFIDASSLCQPIVG